MVSKKGHKLYKIAKKNILGGCMLISKKPEFILPNQWPTYYSRAHKTYLWDIDNKRYLDMMFYVGQSTLGYSNSTIDNKVVEKLKNGNISSLNCPEEVELSKILIQLHPWAGKVKFAKSGGEANAIAIRIARAASKKDKIAICGYHGWHDWYLSVNLKNKQNLNDHLIKGLDPIGVPKNLKETVFPFKYGDFKALKKICHNNKIAAVKMEIARNTEPDIKFLKNVRALTRKLGIILIFDECTSGFRRNLGGYHMLTDVKPDMCMLGKAIANGYPLTAVLGKNRIMNKAKKSFISSTFWTERSGYVAAIETIKLMKKIKSWKILKKNGDYINKKWKMLAEKHKLPISISGISSITSFNFNSKNNLAYKNYITQEMLKSKILATNLIYINVFHTKKMIDLYIKKLDKIFKKIKFFEKNNINIKKYINGPLSVTNFERLN